MILTEKDALEKWCPLTRVARARYKDDVDESLQGRGNFKPTGLKVSVAHGEAVYNRVEYPEQILETAKGVSAASRCIGSACMFWRYSSNVGLKYVEIGDGKIMRAAEPQDREGFCGAAYSVRLP